MYKGLGSGAEGVVRFSHMLLFRVQGLVRAMESLLFRGRKRNACSMGSISRGDPLNPQTLCQTEPLPEARALPLKPTDPRTSPPQATQTVSGLQLRGP